jgi:hypothetical protein
MVLAEDLNNNGKLDLLVTTRSGNVYLLETTATFHPLKSWYYSIWIYLIPRPSQVLARNGFTARYGYQGIYVHEASKEMLQDVYGSYFRVAFEIVDKRTKKSQPSYYDVKVKKENEEKINFQSLRVEPS